MHYCLNNHVQINSITIVKLIKRYTLLISDQLKFKQKIYNFQYLIC